VLAADCSSTCSTQPSSSLSDGSHTWQISAVDTAGNVRDSNASTFTVDTSDQTTTAGSARPPAGESN
jgi:hypothetical protein